MNALALRFCVLAEKQHDVIAAWQLERHGFSRNEIREGLRALQRVFRGVCAIGDLTDEGWFMAAALALGPTGVISHLSALQLMGLRPHEPGPIHVSYAGASRRPREGLLPHRRTTIERWTYRGIPVTSPTQALLDADILPHERYRALEVAERQEWSLSLPLDDVVRLKRRIRGFTRSDTEARFILLCHELGLPLPRVNQVLNGYETDFHWPELRLVVEVDGFEHHKERPNFNTDRYRGLVHRAHGWEVIRISADHVYDEPDLILSALTVEFAG